MFLKQCNRSGQLFPNCHTPLRVQEMLKKWIRTDPFVHQYYFNANLQGNNYIGGNGARFYKSA
jgi:hypothetical protein